MPVPQMFCLSQKRLDHKLLLLRNGLKVNRAYGPGDVRMIGIIATSFP